FAFAAMFSYISGSSFVLQGVFDLSPQAYSVAFAANALGIVGCAQFSGRMAHRFGSGRLLAVGIGVELLGGATILGCVLAGLGLPGVLAGAFLIAGGVGLIFPNAMVLALAAHGRDAGAASALLGVLQFLVGGLAAPLVGVAGEGTPVPMAAVMAGCTLVSALSWRLLARPARPDRD